MTRTTTGTATDELRDVARDAFRLGGRCVGVARDWLGEKREEFNMGRAAGASGTTARGTRYGSGAPAGRSRWERSGASADVSSDGTGVTAHGYRGIGPRGYRRDDSRVHEDVCDMLTDSDALDASNITVTVQDGVVRLAGSVPHRLMKRLAEDLAEGCSGVRDVENALRVGPPPHMGGATGGAAPASGSSTGMGASGHTGTSHGTGGASPAGSGTASASGAGTPGTTSGGGSGGSSGPTSNA